MHASHVNLHAGSGRKYSVMKSVSMLLVMLAGVQGCATLTDAEREAIAYNLNEARSIYEERFQACLDADGYMVTETLTGSRRLSISEMEWAYCVR